MKKTLRLILGLGKSGQSVLNYAIREKWDVIGVDKESTIQELQPLYPMISFGIDSDRFVFDELIVSPGISPKHPIYEQARREGIPIKSEMEIALSLIQRPLIGVTGTNGKTTTVSLIAYVLNREGIRAIPCGNIGDPLLDHIETKADVFVVELSSFQLETITISKFCASTILNITPDHLERYETMEDYRLAKLRLVHLSKQIFARFDTTSDGFVDQFGPGNRIYPWMDEEMKFFLSSIEEYQTREQENLIAAFAITQQWQVKADTFLRHLKTFSKPPHRIEFVKQIDEICFYDDSKGTNIDAVVFAVEAMQQPVILLAGGKDKKLSFCSWKTPFAGKVKHVIAFGETKEKIRRDLYPEFEVILCDTLREAVLLSRKLARPLDAVLLSPGCSSFDQFKNYEHRSQVFKSCIEELK